MAQTIHASSAFRISCRALNPGAERSHALFLPPFTLVNNQPTLADILRRSRFPSRIRPRVRQGCMPVSFG